ncbi:MAG: HNH endonuclease [Candidatus Woesearchaeota archaeon]
MAKIAYALRDEKINVKAMTLGSLIGDYSHQIILCKKTIIPGENTGPFLLDAKKTKPNYPLSDLGKKYSEKTKKTKYNLKYISYVDTYLKIEINHEVFDLLHEKHFFSIWDPEAPLSYFKDKNEGYIVLFRVYEIQNTIPEKLLKKGRSGRNYFFNLSETCNKKVNKPVLSNEKYNEIKENLINQLILNGFIKKITHTNYNKPIQNSFPPLQKGETITNDRLMDIFKCGMMRGMRKSNKTNSLVLVSDPNKLYNDRWENDIFHYTGEGLKGDQKLNSGQNKTLANSNDNDVKVYLFEKFNPNEYTYVDQVELSDDPYQEKQYDEDNNLRNVWVFPLKLKKHDSPPEISEENFKKNQKEKQKEVKNVSNDKLRKLADHTNNNPTKRNVSTKRYERNPYITELAKRYADGICQLCEQPAPFKVTGEPYLETHHIKPLSEGGKDSLENTIALCPNCHAKMDKLNLKTEREKLKEKAKKQINYI